VQSTDREAPVCGESPGPDSSVYNDGISDATRSVAWGILDVPLYTEEACLID
jgi:hypothetical protein